MEQHSSKISELAGREIDLEPQLPGKEKEFRDFCRRFARRLKAADAEGRQQVIEEAREQIEHELVATTKKADVSLQFACSVVVDVVAQGWELKAGKKIQIRSPADDGGTPDEIKRRVRAGHLLERDAQLRQTSVADFIKGMEQRRLGPSGWVSIFSLMRDSSL